MTNTLKEKILNAVSDAASDFLYYDREEDEDLPLFSAEDAIGRGEITIEEIVKRFEEKIRLEIQ